MCFRRGAQSVRARLGLIITILGAVGCAPAPDRAKHSVEEYRQNAELRQRVFARCTGDPGSLAQSPDCVNAREAERLEGVGSLRTLPPLDLPASSAHSKN
jgi:hypothetical protein